MKSDIFMTRRETNVKLDESGSMSARPLLLLLLPRCSLGPFSIMIVDLQISSRGNGLSRA